MFLLLPKGTLRLGASGLQAASQFPIANPQVGACIFYDDGEFAHRCCSTGLLKARLHSESREESPAAFCYDCGGDS
jgi:hypothetical protein